jgi:hypothetical protein
MPGTHPADFYAAVENASVFQFTDTNFGARARRQITRPGFFPESAPGSSWLFAGTKTVPAANHCLGKEAPSPKNGR